MTVQKIIYWKWADNIYEETGHAIFLFFFIRLCYKFLKKSIKNSFILENIYIFASEITISL